MSTPEQHDVISPITTDLLLAVAAGVASPDEIALVHAATLNDRELRVRLGRMLPPPDEDAEIAEAVTGEAGGEDADG